MNSMPRRLCHCLVVLCSWLPVAFAQEKIEPQPGTLSPEISRSFPAPSEPFDRHVKLVKQHLLKTQLPGRRDRDVAYNLPFDLKANTNTTYRGQFLLIHGLNDSPYVWRDMAEQLVERGFDVRAILLPGHGSTPEAQLNISSKQWIKAAREHLALYRQPGVPIYLGGFSLGGVIATLLATETPDLAGLLLFSPAYKSQMDHLLRWAGVYSWFEPWVFGGIIIEDNPVKYNSIPINGAYQYYKTAKRLQRRWPKKPLTVPTLMVGSVYDSVVDMAYAQSSFTKGFKGAKRFILYDNEQASTAFDEPDRSADVIYRQSAYPELRILNQSHQSVLVHRDNPLYGEEGDVLVCNGNEWEVFSRCLYYSGQHWYGAQNTASPDEAPVARSTYNPDFDFVLQQFDALFQ